MPTAFIETLHGLVNPAHVAQIEELRATRGVSLILYDPMGQQIAALPAPYEMPPGFIEAAGATPRSVRAGDVLRVFVNLNRVARIAAADPQGARPLYGVDGRLIGVAHEPLASGSQALDLPALGYHLASA
jgi:hypothetical protein